MAEKKSVLNVTVIERIASSARSLAATRGTTISSVVEEALAKYLEQLNRREAGLLAIDEYYREHGYPTPEEKAAAEAHVAEEEQLIAEVERQNVQRGGSAA
jgi:hypothetical protein